MAEEKPFSIHEYLEIGLRRKWFIIIPFVISVFVTIVFYKSLPKVYQAATLILVSPQKVPEAYVRSTVTEPVNDRLTTITQEILSRTRLEKIVEEFNLYPELRNKDHMEGIIEVMRKSIQVKVQGRGTQNAFTISFEGKEPRTVMLVTNKLASLFIEENLKGRESRAEGTSQFINRELISMEEELKKRESEMRYYKERYMGQLPQQLEPNLRTLERLQQQLKTTRESIRAVEERNTITQSMIEEFKKIEAVVASIEPRRELPSRMEGILDVKNERNPEDQSVGQLNTLKRELENAQSRYTQNHPDVIALKKKIASLEVKVKEVLEKQEAKKENRLKETSAHQETFAERDLSPPGPVVDPANERMTLQYREQQNEGLLETKRLKEEEKALREQISLYQRRVEDTPKREQELIMITRDYDRVMANYQSLLDKKIQAQMAENLERKQQGEHFKILDPARLPEKPIKPDRNKILLMGLMIGLGAGLGLAWFRESFDKSFRKVSDLEEYLGIPVLATIPNLKEEKKAA